MPERFQRHRFRAHRRLEPKVVNRKLGIHLPIAERHGVLWSAIDPLGGDRVAAFEIMGSNLRVKDTILHGESEDRTYYRIIEGSQPFGMMTFDQSIVDLYRNGLITEETAMGYASRKATVGRAIDSIKSERGEKTTSIAGLTIDKEYGKRGSFGERGKWK